MDRIVDTSPFESLRSRMLDLSTARRALLTALGRHRHRNRFRVRLRQCHRDRFRRRRCSFPINPQQTMLASPLLMMNRLHLMPQFGDHRGLMHGDRSWPNFRTSRLLHSVLKLALSSVQCRGSCLHYQVSNLEKGLQGYS